MGYLIRKIIGQHGYYIDTDGIVWFKSAGITRQLKTQMNYDNTPYVQIRGKNYTIHRLLAMHFIKNPTNKPLVCHRNDIKTDNRLSNLYWGTHADNAKDAAKNSRIKDPHRQKNLNIGL